MPEVAVSVLGVDGRRQRNRVLAAETGGKVSVQPFRACEDVSGFKKAGGSW